MEIAVTGAGPAGSWAAILLAKRGHTVTLIDSQGPWEKPCGGAVTARALSSFDIVARGLPRQSIERVTIFFGSTNTVSLTPQAPISVFSRKELGRGLLNEAAACGVRILTDRVLQVRQDRRRWQISTQKTAVEADYLVGADGATSTIRRMVGEPLGADDLLVTLGYFIPGHASDHMKIFFTPSLEGYIWSFPRTNHISYGLITRSAPSWSSRARALLANFIEADLGPDSMEQADFFSAPVPCLRSASWKRNRIAGDGWALAGDAAGLADPITGEGIYFAFRSAEILADTIGRPEAYTKAVWDELGCELARAGQAYRRFYGGRFFAGNVRKRTIQLARRSRTVRQILGNLLIGNQPYRNLKKTLTWSIPAVGWDLITGRE